MSGVVSPVFQRRLEEARALHRRGMLEQSQEAYEALLGEEPESADLIGLMGVLAAQRQELAKSEMLLRQALELPASPRIHLRNLNNALAILKEQDRHQAARTLIGDNPPAWPRGTAPDAGERATLMSLATALGFFGRPDHALALMESALSDLGDGDAEALALAGRLALELADNERAVVLLEQAARADPSDWQALAALNAGYILLGRAEDAQAAALQLGRALPLYVAPAQTTQSATILILNNLPRKFEHLAQSPEDLHFRKNYICQLARRHGANYRFASFFGDLDEPVPQLPPTDIVFNNMASGEIMNIPGRLERAQALVDRIALPVINHPNAVFQVTRQKSAERLRTIAGLRVPKIARYRRDANLLAAIISDIESNFDYPLIVRHVAADSSSRSLVSEKKTALRVHDRNELRLFLERLTWPEFYVIEYVDLQKPDGNFRKLRGMLFPDEVIIGSGGFYSEWMVGGWRHVPAGKQFYDTYPHLVDEMNSILLDPVGMLGSHVLRVLEEVRDRMPLDVSGIDFDIDDEGRLVLFEVGSTMNFLQRETTPPHHRMPEEVDERINRAFDRLIASRIGQDRTDRSRQEVAQTPTP